MQRVLITRASPDDRMTAAAVETLGLNPVCIPLTRVVPIDSSLADLRETPPVDALMVVTSVRALEALSGAGLRPWMALQRWAVVGRRSADFLDDLKAQIVAGPADSIADLMPQLAGVGSPLVYLCGAERKSDLETSGLAVEIWPVYRAVKDRRAWDQQIGSLLAAPPDFALAYSARSVELVLDGLAAHDAMDAFPAMRWICLSNDVAKRLPRRFRTHVAERPTEQALLEALMAAAS